MSNFRLNKCADIRRTLAKVCDMVANNELDTKQANSICYACQIALSIKKLELAVDERNDEHSVSASLGLSQLLDV